MLPYRPVDRPGDPPRVPGQTVKARASLQEGKPPDGFALSQHKRGAALQHGEMLPCLASRLPEARYPARASEIHDVLYAGPAQSPCRLQDPWQNAQSGTQSAVRGSHDTIAAAPVAVDVYIAPRYKQ